MTWTANDLDAWRERMGWSWDYVQKIFSIDLRTHTHVALITELSCIALEHAKNQGKLDAMVEEILRPRVPVKVRDRRRGGEKK